MPKKYLYVKARLFYWKNDRECETNARRIGRELNARGYDVKYVNEDDLGLHPGQSLEEASEAALMWFNIWLHEEDDEHDNYEKKLLIFGYFGHGDIGNDVTVGERNYGELRALNMSDFEHPLYMEFEMTPLRLSGRDGTDFDFLCLLECCWGGYEDLIPYAADENPHSEEGKVMETVSASDGIIPVEGVETDWAQRYAIQLKTERSNGEELSVQERYELMKASGDAKATWRREDGDESIVLPRQL